MRKVLIANRGEIAVRVARAARAIGIGTVAVYSDPDRDGVHVDAADEAVPLRGATPGESYLRTDKIMEAAARSGADAVHPGYGFLSENADFARACLDAGLVFVGPAPEVIASMGDKLRAKELVRAVGVPVLETYSPDAVPHDAYPLIVKAAAGGGGKGMRIVEEGAALPDAVAAARREAAGAFGDERVFVERYLTRPRHVEVQILGDNHGTVVHLGERECSIQRRHQKIIEEAPSPGVDTALRARLTDAAVAVGEALRYTNAGTVEFIVDEDGAFYFLEVNTRVQVEHPVTELAWSLHDGSALDLVRLQFLVACGNPLPFAQHDLVLARHAIEARVYAEDPANEFLPSTGTLHVWEPDDRVRVDAGVRSGSEVSVHYDPLLAKLVAVAPTRNEAASLLAAALDASRMHGVATNRDLLVAVLRHPAFLAGHIDTGFLDEHAQLRNPPTPDEATVALHAAAAALSEAHSRARAASVLPHVPIGWRNNRSQMERVVYEHGARVLDVGYARERDGRWRVELNGDAHEVAVLAWPGEREDGCLTAEMAGRRVRVHLRTVADAVFADSALGHTTFVRRPRFPRGDREAVPGGLLAPMPGTVVTVAVEEGTEVARGDLLLTLEAMKMEHRVTAPHDGVVTGVPVGAGEQVGAGDVLVILAAPGVDDASSS